MTVKFRYQEEKSEITGTILRPVASLEFRSRGGEGIEIPMYIDSGADMTLIPRSFGRLLRLELKKDEIKHLRGVGGGEVHVIVTNVEIRMNGLEFQISVAWALAEDVPTLLGRTDLFDRFKILFDQGEGVIIFEDKGGF